MFSRYLSVSFLGDVFLFPVLSGGDFVWLAGMVRHGFGFLLGFVW